MKKKTCCFTGHREITDSTKKLKNQLKEEIIKLIHEEVIYFGSGGARGFDLLAAETVLEIQKTYSNIKLILVLPCYNHTKGWNRKDIKTYEKIKTNADKITIISKHYYDGCMKKRNCHMVDHSAVCICYQRKPYGGTAFTVQYAKEKKLRIISL